MQRIGYLFMLFGALAIFLNFFNYVPRLLFWIYNWGDTVAWVINIGFIVVGAVLYYLGKKNNSNH